MSTLQTGNIHFESTANNRLEYAGSNTFHLYAGGNHVFTANSTHMEFKSATYSVASADALNQVLTDQASIDWDVSIGQIATVTLAGNRTMNAPTNLKVGTYILHVIQDATGSRTLTWNGVFKWTGGVAPTLSTTASTRDLFSFVCDGTNLYGSLIPDVR